MKKLLSVIAIIIILLTIYFLYLVNNPKILVKQPVIIPTATEPTISILPVVIYPGDPIMVIVNASSTVDTITFDNKAISTFMYKNNPTAFIAIPFEEKVLKHTLLIKLSNGMILSKPILLVERKKIKKPLGIPEKLGGNTSQAGKALVDNLAKENKIINNIKTATTTLWSKVFVLPLTSLTITDSYGYNRDTAGYVIVHKGTDLRASTGTSVKSMNDGIVRLARTFTVYGNTIIIDHGLGVQTIYMHLSKIEVKEGDSVQAGQVIGLSGMTGYAEAPHLHVSIKINGISIDPMKFLGFFDIIP